jgi:hypothetical protein
MSKSFRVAVTNTPPPRSLVLIRTPHALSRTPPVPRMIGHASPVLILDELETGPFTEGLRKPKARRKLARRSRPSMPSTGAARANGRCMRASVTTRCEARRKIQNGESMRCGADVESWVTVAARANRRRDWSAATPAVTGRIEVPSPAFRLSRYRHNSFIERSNRVTPHRQHRSHSSEGQKGYVATNASPLVCHLSHRCDEKVTTTRQRPKTKSPARGPGRRP